MGSTVHRGFESLPLRSRAARERGVADRLAAGGFIAAGEEAAELVAAAGDDAGRLEALVARRLTGEPLAWITGTARFCGIDLLVHPGVYVPRWHSELLARRAAARLPDDGLAVDLCTGCGALAKVLATARRGARVLASDVDPGAVACARANGVEAYAGDLLEPLPGPLDARVDVVAGVVPYVPAGEQHLLQRDTFAFESTVPYAGGEDGTDVLRRAIRGAGRVLRPGGALLLELGGDQPDLLRDELAAAGLGHVEVVVDEDGDVRGIEATRA